MGGLPLPTNDELEEAAALRATALEKAATSSSSSSLLDAQKHFRAARGELAKLGNTTSVDEILNDDHVDDVAAKQAVVDHDDSDDNDSRIGKRASRRSREQRRAAAAAAAAAASVAAGTGVEHSKGKDVRGHTDGARRSSALKHVQINATGGEAEGAAGGEAAGAIPPLMYTLSVGDDVEIQMPNEWQWRLAVIVACNEHPATFRVKLTDRDQSVEDNVTSERLRPLLPLHKDWKQHISLADDTYKETYYIHYDKDTPVTSSWYRPTSIENLNTMEVWDIVKSIPRLRESFLEARVVGTAKNVVRAMEAAQRLAQVSAQGGGAEQEAEAKAKADEAVTVAEETAKEAVKNRDEAAAKRVVVAAVLKMITSHIKKLQLQKDEAVVEKAVVEMQRAEAEINLSCAGNIWKCSALKERARYERREHWHSQKWKKYIYEQRKKEGDEKIGELFCQLSAQTLVGDKDDEDEGGEDEDEGSEDEDEGGEDEDEGGERAEHVGLALAAPVLIAPFSEAVVQLRVPRALRGAWRAAEVLVEPPPHAPAARRVHANLSKGTFVIARIANQSETPMPIQRGTVVARGLRMTGKAARRAAAARVAAISLQKPPTAAAGDPDGALPTPESDEVPIADRIAAVHFGSALSDTPRVELEDLAREYEDVVDKVARAREEYGAALRDLEAKLETTTEEEELRAAFDAREAALRADALRASVEAGALDQLRNEAWRLVRSANERRLLFNLLTQYSGSQASEMMPCIGTMPRSSTPTSEAGGTTKAIPWHESICPLRQLVKSCGRDLQTLRNMRNMHIKPTLNVALSVARHEATFVHKQLVSDDGEEYVAISLYLRMLPETKNAQIVNALLTKAFANPDTPTFFAKIKEMQKKNTRMGREAENMRKQSRPWASDLAGGDPSTQQPLTANDYRMYHKRRRKIPAQPLTGSQPTWDGEDWLDDPPHRRQFARDARQDLARNARLEIQKVVTANALRRALAQSTIPVKKVEELVELGLTDRAALKTALAKYGDVALPSEEELSEGAMCDADLVKALS